MRVISAAETSLTTMPWAFRNARLASSTSRLALRSASRLCTAHSLSTPCSCGVQRVPDLLGDHDHVRAVAVLGQRQVLLHLVELHVLDVGVRVLLAIDRLGLQRRIHLGEGHRHGVGTQGVEGVDVDLVLHHAHLDAAEVLHLVDRPLGVGRVAEAVLPPRQVDQPDRRHLGAEPVAHLAVEQLRRLPSRCSAGRAGRTRRVPAPRRRSGTSRCSRCRKCRCAPRHHLRIVAEHAIGETLNLQLAAGLGRRALDHCVHAVSIGCPLGVALPRRNVRSWNWAWAAPVARAAAIARVRIEQVFIVYLQWIVGMEIGGVAPSPAGRIAWYGESSHQPLQGNQHERRERDQQEHHGQLGPQEGPKPVHQLLHRDLGDAANDVEHNAHGWRDQADGVVHDEEHAEIDRVDARLLDDRHEHRRQDHDRGPHVQRGADHHHEDHDHRHQERLVAGEGFEHGPDLGRHVRRGDQEGRHQRRGDEEHDHGRALGRGDEQRQAVPQAQIAIHDQTRVRTRRRRRRHRPRSG